MVGADLPDLFLRDILEFCLDQRLADFLRLLRGIVHQIFLQSHQRIRMAAVLNLPTLAQAHKPDEYVEIADIERCVQVYRELICLYEDMI